VILFYGCWTSPGGASNSGHYFFGVESGPYSMRRRHDGRIVDDPAHYVPWGLKVDGGLAPRGGPNGIAALSQCVTRMGDPDEQWWSALSWWDNSVDTRAGSSATFLVDRRCGPIELVEEAKKAFPQIFARFKYELVLPKWPEIGP
jgi:hypothetical protein